ncbi:hypothetical protein EFY87_04580 [Flexivirga caeni]|uniref:TY-Chap central domain-containing protein n=1 Tax=Flexivirga caeni TaxID=2294115 RepID=A0A3M9MFC0_9MICO|nr:hypothetical protein [Flexivirga caeni]RNI24250.1 hypothetical protein EFY87_04580 [Flexivirga caeni]
MRVSAGEPAIELFTLAVNNITSAGHAARELVVVNRRHRWSRWTYRRSKIWQQLHICPTAFSTTLFDEMLRTFVADHRAVTEDLADRLDGTAAFA